MVVHVINPISWEMEAGRLVVQGYVVSLSLT